MIGSLMIGKLSLTMKLSSGGYGSESANRQIHFVANKKNPQPSTKDACGLD